MDELITKRGALEAFCLDNRMCLPRNSGRTGTYIKMVMDNIKALPAIKPDEKLERCRFEYIHACKIVSIPTPDVTKKDKQDAYAVIKALYPIFGDVTFAKVERGDSDTDND